MLRIGKKILKVIGYIIGGILMLLIIIFLLLQTQPVQDFVKDKAVSFFKDKVDTEASIGSLRLDFPYDLVIEDLHLEDQKGDTLAYVSELSVAADMWGLFKGKLGVSSLDINGFVGNMSRNEADSAFNFDFIIQAFTTADTTTVAPPSNKKPFEFTIDAIHISNARFAYIDPIAGFEMEYYVGNFDVEISKFDMTNSILHINEVVLANSQGEFIQTHDVPPTQEESEPFAFDLNVRDVTIDRVKFAFESIPDQLKLHTDVGHIDGILKEIDILQMNYIAENLNLENTFVELDLSGGPDTINQEKPSSLDTITLNVGADKFTFSNVNFRFDDHTTAEAPGFDPMHFAFSKIKGELTEPKYKLVGEDSYATGTVESLTLNEEAGMSLDKLHGYLEFTPEFTLVKNLELIAGQTDITGDFRISYNSLESMAEEPGEIGLDIDMAPSKLHLNDVVYFVPDMAAQMKQLPASARDIRMEGEVSGKVSSLDIAYFQLHGLRNTHIDIRGAIAGIPNVNNINADIVLNQFKTTRGDLMAVLPDTLIPENITIPESMALNGSIKGNLNDAVANVKIITSMGNATVDAELHMMADSVYSYVGTVAIDKFNVGKLIQQEETMGTLSLNLKADGKGFTLEELNTKVTGVVEAFEYNDYTYNNLKVNGQLFKKEYSGDLSMEDENLAFDFKGTVDMNDSIPEFMFNLNLDNADLHALNFYPEDLRVKGKIDSDIRARGFENLRGHIEIQDVVINQEDQQYFIDSLRLDSKQEGEENILTISSEILDAHFQGKFEVIQLPQVIQAHINQYYDLFDSTSIEGIEPQSFAFNINVKKTDLITDLLVPELETLEAGPINGTYNSEDWTMDINISVPKIDYAGIVMDSLKINLNSDEESLNYDARLAHIATGVIPVKNIWLEGVVAANHINTALHIIDEAGEDKYLFGGIFTSWEEQYFQLQMTPGRLLMNYDPWDVYPGNSIQFYPSGILIEDMRLSNNEQKISAETTINEEQDTLINVGFNNFLLSTVGDIVQQDTTFLGGVLNGNADINTSAETFAFTSNLSVQNFAFKGDTLGNLSLTAFSTEGTRYDVTANLDGQDNLLLVEGYYEADSTTGILHFDANLETLTVKSIEAFSMGELKDSRGYLTGNLKIRGTVKDPDINGALSFKDVLTRVTYSNTWLVINDEQIQFNRSGIHLNNFTINDGSGNTFNVNGDILTEDYSYFRLNLDARLNNFLLVNTGAGDNPLFYGTLIVDSDISVRGDSELPIINMDISLNDESRMTYIVPESQLTSVEREGLIEFVDKSRMRESGDTLATDLLASDTLEAKIQGISFTANIDIDNSNAFTIVIDPATGDRLSNLRGEANLAMNINPTGDISINGRYTVEEGKYTLSFFGLTRREFSIVEGSYILWTGDPLNARMDIRAEYEVLASPQPLVSNLQNTAGSQYAKQPILVFLDLEGRLLKPEIAFQLSMPEGEQRASVMSLLQEINSQESRLLEEVLSLVVFRRFSGGNILAGGGGGAEATARQSVSRVLSQQLNQLGSKIGGVDLSFDVQSYQDYSQTGEAYNRTAVELGLSKQFFNNRVIVKVAGNFDVEGEQNRDQSNMADFAGDIVVEYLITEDGRFRLMGFRRNEYDDLLQGLITETGIGVLFVKEYDTLKELFSAMNNEGG